MLEAEVTDAHRSGGCRRRSLRRSTTSMSLRRGLGEPGRSALIGLAVVADLRARCEVCGSRPSCVADPQVLAAVASAIRRLRGHNVKALMRWLLDRGASTCRPAARHGDRARTSSTRPTPATRWPTCSSGTRRTSCRPTSRGRAGQLDFADEAVTTARARGREALAVAHLSSRIARGTRQAGHGRLVRDDREPARRGAGRDGARRHRRRHRRAAPSERTADGRGRAPGGRAPASRRPAVQLQLTHAAPRDPVHRDAIWPRRRGPRPGSRPTPPRWRSCATSGRSSSIRCCNTARSRSCAAPTASVCSPRSRPTGASTPPSTRPWPAPAGSAATARTCTTSRCAATRVASSAAPSCPAPGNACCWSPTTTRSSCDASPTSPPTRG